MEKEPDMSIISQRHNERKEAMERDSERQKQIWDAIEKVKKIEKTDKGNNEKTNEFIREIIKKTDEIQKKNYEKDKKIKKENDAKKVKRVSGDSLKELLNSPDFQKMWKDTTEER